jgi:N-acetylmuramoyl-L-alanine amidase
MRLVLYLTLALALAGATRPASGRSLEFVGRTFVLDPGHGTRLPSGAPLNVGAVGAGGVAENVVALQVATRLAQLLRAEGARIVLTRSLAKPYRVATNRARDNRARAALANRLKATAFVSIHCDGSLDHSQRGTSVFWLRPNSAALADAVRVHLRPLGLGESQFRARHLAVTEEARVPAVLVELGFVSNPQQARLLSDPHFQAREASALESALTDVFGTAS